MAKIPEGASKDKVPEMLQALLADRFKMAAHRETKDHPAYALVVGKSGPKLKEAEPDPAAPAGRWPAAPAPKSALVMGSGGYPGTRRAKRRQEGSDGVEPACSAR